jgi:glycosyltransferase involved in cell wall biosynthesis
MPDCVPEGVPEAIAERSATLWLGCDLVGLDAEAPPREGPALVLWNQRWEYDKGPEDFFSVLFDLAQEGLPFRIAIAGERFRESPIIFDVAQRRLADRIEHFGFIQDRLEYARLLRRSDIVVSTARHEFFGVAMVEAVYCGCFPLFPNRLTYPEVIPEECHARHLYSDLGDLTSRLRKAILGIDETRRTSLSHVAGRFDWRARIGGFDAALEAAAERGTRVGRG